MATDGSSGMTAVDYYEFRLDMIRRKREAGENPYPHKFNQTISLGKFRVKYDDVKPEARHEDLVESITGRVMLRRAASKKLAFLTIRQDDIEVQIMFDFRYYDFSFGTFESDADKLKYFVDLVGSIARGDIIGACGFVGKSHKGELSLFPRSFKVLTPCLKMLPPSFTGGIKDDETRYRQRYLDLLVNRDVRNVFLARTKIINFIRTYLNNLDFLEVQTPILVSQAGGASAKPFKTFHNDHKMDMVMRIAPELFLKQLVVGGFDRVYELGQQFRNESIDRTHSPEFTSIELYMAYADYNDLMEMVEDIFSNLALITHGSYKIKCKPFDEDEIVDVDFTPPFTRYDFVKEIEAGCGKTLPSDLGSDEARVFLEEICEEFGVSCSYPRTNARLLDKLAGHFIEPKCRNPSFIINHPLIMSPLAKWHRDNPNVTERFELFMLGYEFANAYTELNDPEAQRKTFEDQMKAKASGDDEAHGIDETFIDALEYGLPPTGGLGIGIDRTVMLFTGSTRIQDVILFPTMKPESKLASKPTIPGESV